MFYTRIILVIIFEFVYSNSQCPKSMFISDFGCSWCDGYIVTDIYDSNKCVLCEKGSVMGVALNKNLTSDDCIVAECPLNRYKRSDECQWCSGYLEIVNNITECIECPQDHYTSKFPLSFSSESCVYSECAPWEYMSTQGCDFCNGYVDVDSNGQNECNECPDGTVIWFSDTKSSIRDCKCHNYEEGFDPNSEIITCFTCDSVNTRFHKNRTHCISCSDPDGDTDSRCVCGPGEQGMNGKPCGKCKGNFFKNEQSRDACTACPIGKITNNDRTECNYCPLGMTTSHEDGTCIFIPDCPDVESNTKFPRIEGYYYSGSDWPMHTGTTWTFGKNPIDFHQKCSAICTNRRDCYFVSMYFKAAIAEFYCSILSRHRSWQEKATDFSTFEYDVSNLNRSNYMKCREKCNSGQYLDLDDVTCVHECPPGSTIGIGNKKCVACGVNTFKSIKGNHECEQCGVNTFNYKIGSFIADDCLNCAPGRYLFGNYCQDCDRSTYKNISGIQECTPCRKGTFTNHYQAVSESECICIYGSVLNDNMICENCIIGSYHELVSDTCINCPAGKYSISFPAVTDSCLFCSSNSFSVLGSHKCLCNAGYEKLYNFSETCFNCKAGKYKVTINDKLCTECEVGKYSAIIASTTNDCTTCPTNSNSNSASSELRNCICNSGYFMIWPNYTCSICEAGKYSIFVDSQNWVCKTCPTKSFSNIGSSSCLSCNPGKYISVRNSTQECISCDTGKFNQKTNSISIMDCLNCPRGKFNPFTASTSIIDCQSCREGKFNPNTNSTSIMDCQSCPRGKFNPFTASTSKSDCQSCPEGKFHTMVAISNSFICKECVC